MTDEKLLEVIDRYEHEVPRVLDSAIYQRYLSAFEKEALEHLTEMFPQMREFVRQGRREKLMRWLGWVQSVLFMCGVYTLDEMKQHNMPDEELRCTGYCVFDGDILGPEDLACPVHGMLAQERAMDAGWQRLSWMKAARASYPYPPKGPPLDYFDEGT